jgi:hypothetical protein
MDPYPPRVALLGRKTSVGLVWAQTLPAVRLGFNSLTTLASPARCSRKSTTLLVATLHMPASGQGASRLNTQTGGARIATQRLGRPKVWLRHGVGVRRPGMHARSRPCARRVARSPGSRGRVRRCRRDEARRPAHPPTRSCSGRNLACTYRCLVRRQRVRGESRPETLARRSGHPCGSAGRRPCLEHAVACAGHSRA